MRNRIVDLCMGVALISGFAKIYFLKFLFSPIHKNNVKYKFPGIRSDLGSITKCQLKLHFKLQYLKNFLTITITITYSSITLLKE